MPELAVHARWSEAVRTTLLLWSFVLLVFLPGIIARHSGEPWTGVLLDSATILYSIALALGLFAVSRATIPLPPLVRLPVRALAVVAVAGINVVFDLLFQGWIAQNIAGAWDTLPSDFGRGYSSLRNYILVFGINMILFHVNYTRRAAIAQEVRLAEVDAAAQQAQLAALRYQLNPHFLFNSLNSISALIVTRRNDDAEAMTDKLSRFLRSSLNADPTELIRLEDELALTEEYLDIESVRFGERLDVSVRCAAGAGSVLVPSFLVQPLVENAVKHGVARSSTPVKIEITASLSDDMLCINVENGLGEREATALLPGSMNSGLGLINVRRRLQTVYGERATLTTAREDGRFCATICIPQVTRTN